MLGIGSTELLIIVVVGFMLFGPDKLPQMGRTLGRALRQFRETQERMTSVVQAEVIDPMAAAASAPLKPKHEASDDDDADSEDAAEAPAHKETFAERRARLAAEKAARESAPTEGIPAEEVPAEQAEPERPEPDESPLKTEEKPERTMADLYSRRPRKHGRASDAEEAEKGAAAPDAKPAASEEPPVSDGSVAEGGEQ